MFESIIRKPDVIRIHHEFGNEDRSDVQVTTEIVDGKLNVYVFAYDTPLKYVRLRWNFEKKCTGNVLGDAWERGYGDMGWQNIHPTNGMPWYFMIQKENYMAGYGVQVRPSALCMWQLDPRGVTLWLDVRNGGQGILLKGRKLHACSVVYEEYELNNKHTFEISQEFCQKMCEDPIFPDKPVYGANNWYYAYGHSSREEILADTDYLMDMCKNNENPPFMVIDDCWQLYRSDNYIGGPWVSNDKFGDMKSLIDEIKEKGARPGIWMRFLYDNSDYIPQECRLESGFLDPSHPEVLEHIQEDIARICSWGVELIKHDFTTFDIFGKWGFQMHPMMSADGWHFYDQTKTTAEIVVNLYKTILEAAQPTHTMILGCNTIGHLGAGLMHMNRSGDDTSGKVWERTLRMGVNTLAFRLPQHKTFYDIDADCLGIMETLPWKQNRLWAKLLAYSGTSLFVSAKPGVLSPEEKEELAQYLKVNSIQSNRAIPLDWQEMSFPEVWKIDGETIAFNWDYEDGIVGLQGTGKNWDFDFLSKLTNKLW